MPEGVDTNAGTTDGGATSGQSWLSSIPENLRDNEAFKGIEKSSDAWQEFVDLKVNSANSVKIPGEDATDEERTSFLDKLGRPETPDKYSFTKPDDISDDLYSKEEEQVFKEAFHSVGLTDTAAKTLWSKYYEMAAKGKADQEQAKKTEFDKAVNSLKDEWKGDTFKKNTEIAHRVFTNVFKDDETKKAATKFFEDTKVNGLSLGDNPMMLKVFARLGQLMGDDFIGMGNNGNSTGGDSEENLAKKRFPNTKFD